MAIRTIIKRRVLRGVTVISKTVVTTKPIRKTVTVRRPIRIRIR